MKSKKGMCCCQKKAAKAQKKLNPHLGKKRRGKKG